MAQLPDRPDLDQLRRIAKELHRAAAGGDPRSVQRLRAVSERTNLAAAQLALAREYGFGSWASLRAAVVDRRCRASTARLSAKHDKQAVYGAADFVFWAQRKGWSAGALPVGAVFSAQSFITAHLQHHWRSYRLSDSLTPTNGRVFLTRTQRPVAVACLGVGAPALVTLLEQLVILGVRSFVAIGPAPAVSSDVGCGDCVVIDSAVETTGSLITTLHPQPTRAPTAG